MDLYASLQEACFAGNSPPQKLACKNFPAKNITQESSAFYSPQRCFPPMYFIPPPQKKKNLQEALNMVFVHYLFLTPLTIVRRSSSDTNLSIVHRPSAYVNFFKSLLLLHFSMDSFETRYIISWVSPQTLFFSEF